MGLLDSIKNDVKKAGTNKAKFIFFKEGTKTRVRFLTDMEEGKEVKFHDSFAAGVNVPCQEVFGRDCEYCDDSDLRTRSQYMWCVWDYEAKEVKILMAAVNNCSPVPALVALYETYGTLCDRDYVISKTGKQQNTTFSVIPMDKVKFRNEKAKPFSEKKMLQLLDKAYPASDSTDDEDDEDERPAKKSSKSKQSTKPKTKKPADDDEEWDEDDDSQEMSYDEMTAKELYQLCKERGIDVRPKKPESFYIKQLEEYDEQKDDWGDDDDDDGDDWGEDEE